jgi:hypothetical protein
MAKDTPLIVWKLRANTENSPKHAIAWLGKSSLKHIVRH